MSDVTTARFCLDACNSCEKETKNSQQHNRNTDTNKESSASDLATHKLFSLCDEFIRLDDEDDLLREVESIDYEIPLCGTFVSKRTMLLDESMPGARERNELLLDNMRLLNEILAQRDNAIAFVLGDDDEESLDEDDEDQVLVQSLHCMFAQAQ